jgi:hypothetical protein
MPSSQPQYAANQAAAAHNGAHATAKVQAEDPVGWTRFKDTDADFDEDNDDVQHTSVPNTQQVVARLLQCLSFWSCVCVYVCMYVCTCHSCILLFLFCWVLILV